MKNRIPIEELIKAEAQAMGGTTVGNNQGPGSLKMDANRCYSASNCRIYVFCLSNQ